MIGSRGVSGGNSGGDSKGSRPEAGGSRERLRPIRRLGAAAQGRDHRKMPNAKEKGRPEKPSLVRADLLAQGNRATSPPFPARRPNLFDTACVTTSSAREHFPAKWTSGLPKENALYP